MLLFRQRGERPDALGFQRLVPALDLAIGLRIKRRGAHVRHPRDSNELLEVARDELGPVVGNHPRFGLRILLLGSFQNPFDVSFLHRLA
jgi:hypothetical protein